MKAVQVECAIARPRDLVFAAFTDFDKSARVFHQAARVDFKSPTVSGMGTEWEQERIYENDKSTIAFHRIIAFDPPSSYVMTTDDESSHETMTLEFFETPGGTRVTFRVEPRTKSFGAKMLGMFLGGMVTGFMREDLNCMKNYIENSAQTGV